MVRLSDEWHWGWLQPNPRAYIGPQWHSTLSFSDTAQVSLTCCNLPTWVNSPIIIAFSCLSPQLRTLWCLISWYVILKDFVIWKCMSIKFSILDINVLFRLRKKNNYIWHTTIYHTCYTQPQWHATASLTDMLHSAVLTCYTQPYCHATFSLSIMLHSQLTDMLHSASVSCYTQPH